MIRKQRDTTWLLLCVLVSLFILSAVSPNIWTWARQSGWLDKLTKTARITYVALASYAAQTPGMAVESADHTRGCAPYKNEVAEKEAVEAKESAEVDEGPGDEEPRSEVTDYHPVEPALKIAKNRDVSGQVDPVQSGLGTGDSEMEGLECPILKPAVQPILRPQEITRLPTEGAETKPTMAGMPRLIHALPYRAVPPEKSDYPDTGLLPLELPSTKAQDPHHAQPTSPPVQRVDVQWVDPAVLLGRLQSLSKEPATSQWAAQARQLVYQLELAVSRDLNKTTAILQELETLNDQALSLAGELTAKSSAASLLRTSHALQRRLDVWQQVLDFDSSATPPLRCDPERLASVLAAIDAVTAGSPQGEAWRSFLLIDALQEWLDKQEAGSPCDPLPPELAQRVLDRLSRTSMTASQRQFASSEPIVALRRELRCWAAKPANASELLKYIEQYETTRLASDAKQVARDCLDLDLSLDGNYRELARCLSEHYRNANVRVAISEKFLNRLMPQRNPEYAKVRETVLGVPVRGRSLTSADLGVTLIPDPHRVRLALDVTGEVAALTTSSAGPATFYSDSQTMYSARKPLEIDLNGIQLSPSTVSVYTRSHLRNVATDYDGVFLIDGLAKKVAHREYNEQRAAASREIKRKVAAQARKRIDREADSRVADISQKLQERFVAPMETLALEPTVIHAKTDRDRFIMRLRLAGENQLGGTTPRPRAPSDSLASLQIHETAINNAIEHLRLDGRTFTLPELSAHVSSRLHFEKPWEIDTNHDNVTITFAPRDAVAVRCEGGQVVITLSIARLRKPPRSWRSFQVRAFYEPKIEGRSAQLARNGVLHLMGKRMSIGRQIPIRGVFAKVFSNNHPIPLTPERLLQDERMSNLTITQFTITDGWVGIALGPKRAKPSTEPSAERTALQSWLLRR